MSANCHVIVIFQFITNSVPSRSRIMDTWSVKLTFSVKVLFHLTETCLLTQLWLYCLSKGTIFCQKTLVFFQKNADVSVIKSSLILNGIFFETKFVFVVIRTKSQVPLIILLPLPPCQPNEHLFDVETKLKQSIFKINNQINSIATTRTWALSKEWIRTWPKTGLVSQWKNSGGTHLFEW